MLQWTYHNFKDRIGSGGKVYNFHPVVTQLESRPDTDYFDIIFFPFSDHTGKFRDSSLEYVTIASIRIIFNSSFINHPKIRFYACGMR
jgi:hypothetical protein